MITKKLIKEVEKFVFGESEKYNAPSVEQIELTNGAGQRLAKKFRADKNIIYLGTLLMDCQLGIAYKNKKLPEHINMSAIKARVVLSKDRKITNLESENIISCVLQHHGIKKFFSLESEIVCNADCYKFVSVKGFLVSLRYTRDMSLNPLMKLLSDKADEKWNALSFDVCKKELAPQYKLIKEIIKYYEA